MNDDVFFATVTDLNARLKKREFSTVELVKAFGERLEKLGPNYNSLALPLTKNRPVPMAPPMAIMLSCRDPMPRFSS